MANNNDIEGGFFGSVWKTVSGFFTVGFSKVWNEFPSAAEKIAAMLFAKLFLGLSITKTGRWNMLFSKLASMKAIDAETTRDLAAMQELPQPLEFLAWLYVVVAFFGLYLKGLAFAITGDLRRKMNRDYEPEIMPYADALRTAFIDPEKLPKVKSILQESGFSDDEIDLLFVSMYRLYDEGTIRELYFRDVITKTKMFERMRQLGYTDKRINEIIQIWPVIPSLGDIVRYIAKEAFEPKMIELFGLLEDYPLEAEKWAKIQGLDKRWVEAEWVSHWRDLGIDFMLEAYHRNIVDWPLVERYMALIEIPPKLREIVKETAFRVYTRVDVRRMHDLGVLNDEELYWAYLDQGYDETKAENMAKFTIAYNAKHDKDLTKSEVLKGYGESLIERDDAVAMLLDMEYDINEVEYLLIYEDYKKEKRLQDMQLKNIANRFQNNLIDSSEARDRLNRLNLSGKKIAILMEQWLIEKFEDIKIPSKTDFDKFFKLGLIDKDNLYTELRKLGYEDYYATLFVQAALKTKGKN